MKFKVGEIVIVIKDQCYVDDDKGEEGNHLGKETTILEVDPIFTHPYKTDLTFDDGCNCWYSEDSLRHKPPKDEPTTWEEVYKFTKWKPEEVTA